MEEKINGESLNETEEMHEHDHHEHEHDHHEHEHHHDHDHEHEHEHHHHDHEHEHHHHDHDHEHHHHHHDHDHDHDHEHEEEQVPGYKLFESHTHEGATVCSFEKNLTMDYAEAGKCMEEAIEVLKQWLNESGAVIGHLKGYIKETTRVRTFSTVGREINSTDKEDKGGYAAFAAIVIGPSEDDLKAKVIEIFAGLK